MAEHNETGQRGEELAAAFLKKKGYSILETNWHFLQFEVDIIALQDDTMVVVEVKTRNSKLFGEPETFVNRQKQNNLIKAANAYIQRYQLDFEVRFDIISVFTGNGYGDINHIEGAFYPLLQRR